MPRKKVSMVFQLFNLFNHLNVLQNVTIGPIKVLGKSPQEKARALAMEPDVILFDEPTSALDPEYTKEVLDVMKELAEEGMTMVVRIVFLEDGRVIEDTDAHKFFVEGPQTERARQFLSKILKA